MKKLKIKVFSSFIYIPSLFWESTEVFEKEFFRMAFFNFFKAMTFFSPLFLFLLFFKRLGKGVGMLVYSAIFSLTLWTLVMYTPGSTSIHQGSFFLWFSWYTIIALTLLRFNQNLFMLIAILSISLNVKLFFADILLMGWNEIALLTMIFMLLVSSLRFNYLLIGRDEKSNDFKSHITSR